MNWHAQTRTDIQEAYTTTKLHIGNMPRTSINDEIEGLFRPFGLVSSFAFTKDLTSGLNTGCGTVDSDVDAQST